MPVAWSIMQEQHSLCCCVKGLVVLVRVGRKWLTIPVVHPQDNPLGLYFVPRCLQRLQPYPSPMVRCIAPALTSLKCVVVPCSLGSPLQIWASPDTELPINCASTDKGAGLASSKGPPISFPLTGVPVESCNTFFHFCVAAGEKYTALAHPHPLVLALPIALLPCDTTVPMSRHCGMFQMSLPLFFQGLTPCVGALSLQGKVAQMYLPTSCNSEKSSGSNYLPVTQSSRHQFMDDFKDACIIFGLL